MCRAVGEKAPSSSISRARNRMILPELVRGRLLPVSGAQTAARDPDFTDLVLRQLLRGIATDDRDTGIPERSPAAHQMDRVCQPGRGAGHSSGAARQILARDRKKGSAVTR